jgi:hypothetical protein
MIHAETRQYCLETELKEMASFCSSTDSRIFFYSGKLKPKIFSGLIGLVWLCLFVPDLSVVPKLNA